MTIKEFEKIVKKENNKIVVAQDNGWDVYVIDKDKMNVLAWICGEESDHFTIYYGLSDRESWKAINSFAETLPSERGLLLQED